jgi:tRNA G18 (ribose-2'-O)-methylase SpoU
LLEESAHPFHPKSIRASAGSVFRAPLRTGPALTSLPHSLPVVALSSDAPPLDPASLPESFALLVGLEGPGLPAAWRERAVSIPLADGVESLNAAASAAVALYAWRSALDRPREPR